MTNMNDNELDNWIYEHVEGMPSNLSPTRDSVPAMMLLKKCVERLRESHFPGTVAVWNPYGMWKLQAEADIRIWAEADTLERCIAKFSYTLFQPKSGEGVL